MRIECSRLRLQEAMGVIAAAVPTQATTPVALDVLMQASEAGLRLQSTDLTVFAEVEILELKEIVPGEALLPVARLVALIRELESENIVIEREPEEHIIKLTAGKDSFRIMGHDPGDFPEPPPASETNAVVLQDDMFRSALRAVTFAASRDATRNQLQGVALILEGKKIHFVASDGKRLAEYVTTFGGELDGRREGIVPLRAIEAIERLLSLDSGDVTVRLDPETQQILVRHERGHVLCRLIQGQMPDYVSLIPTDFDASVEASARDILAAVRKAAVMTTKENAVVTLDVADGQVTVRVSSQDVGSGVIPVDNVEVSGADISASFTVSFLADGLRVMGDAPVRLGLKKERGAAVLHSGRTFRYAFMPVMQQVAQA